MTIGTGLTAMALPTPRGDGLLYFMVVFVFSLLLSPLQQCAFRSFYDDDDCACTRLHWVHVKSASAL